MGYQHLAGPYQVHVLLLSANGELVSKTTQAFNIIAGEKASLNVRTTVAKPTFHTTDAVQITSLICNLMVNTLITGITIQD